MLHKESLAAVIALLLMSFSFITIADQVIYVDVGNYIPAASQFGNEVKGNEWITIVDENAIGGRAFGGPGDNNHANDDGKPYLAAKLPVQVNPGESTADGKTWAAWARLYVPQAVIDPREFDSFFLRTSPDAKTWTPETRGDSSLRWNDPGGVFPACLVDNPDVLVTDVGDGLPWYWIKHIVSINVANSSSIDPVLTVGSNYMEIGVRESDPVNFPIINIVCFRNDDLGPSDAEALASGFPVEPAGRLATSWGQIKVNY